MCLHTAWNVLSGFYSDVVVARAHLLQLLLWDKAGKTVQKDADKVDGVLPACLRSTAGREWCALYSAPWTGPLDRYTHLRRPQLLFHMFFSQLLHLIHAASKLVAMKLRISFATEWYKSMIVHFWATECKINKIKQILKLKSLIQKETLKQACVCPGTILYSQARTGTIMDVSWCCDLWPWLPPCFLNQMLLLWTTAFST